MKLINKDALVAEIESLLDKGKYHDEYDCAYRDGNNGALCALKGKVNSLEVKEVDLEKEVKAYMDNEMKFLSDEVGYDTLLTIAKHFFELGLKAQKGEGV